MPLVKPIRGLQINLAHPLAGGLVGCYLFNEGSGKKVFNVIRPSASEGTLEGAAAWKPGGEGFCVEFAAGSDAINIANSAAVSFDGYTDSYTIIIRAKAASQSGSHRLLEKRSSGVNRYPVSLQGGAGATLSGYIWDGTNLPGVSFGTVWDGAWHTLAFVVDNSADYLYTYKDGIRVASAANTTTATTANSSPYYVGNNYSYTADFVGQVAWLFMYKRALSAAEVARLYREPFCMFQPAVSPCLLSAPAGQIVSLAGTCTVSTSVTASLKLTRRIAAMVSAHSQVWACLTVLGEVPPAQQWFSGSLNIEHDWLLAALFGGMTANAFMLGTAITLGWFWTRRLGCCALYRGPTINQIDFANTLTVTQQDAGQISPPLYVAHGSNSTYFYAIRRFNTCGYQERSLAAVAKVAIDAGGNLTAPQPNNIFAVAAKQIAGNKIQLVWFYCPLHQKSAPARFRIYYDAASGQIDYENPITTVSYQGQKFYSCQIGAPEAGTYFFAIRAEDDDGVQDCSAARLIIQLTAKIPEPVEILSAESV